MSAEVPTETACNRPCFETKLTPIPTEHQNATQTFLVSSDLLDIIPKRWEPRPRPKVIFCQQPLCWMAVEVSSQGSKGAVIARKKGNAECKLAKDSNKE